jgi:hypothetical protein
MSNPIHLWVTAGLLWLLIEEASWLTVPVFKFFVDAKKEKPLPFA